jgi:hypothetical protein
MINFNRNLREVLTSLRFKGLSKIIRNGRLHFPIFALLSCGTLTVFSQEWRGLRPAVSTRADAEKILGQPRYLATDFGLYTFGNEEISIQYSPGPCKVKKGLNWRTSRGLINTITVRFDSYLSVDQLPWNLKSFSRRNHPTIEDNHFYSSPGKVIEVQTNTNLAGAEKIIELYLSPASRFACKKKIVKERGLVYE